MAQATRPNLDATQQPTAWHPSPEALTARGRHAANKIKQRVPAARNVQGASMLRVPTAYCTYMTAMPTHSAMLQKVQEWLLASMFVHIKVARGLLRRLQPL